MLSSMAPVITQCWEVAVVLLLTVTMLPSPAWGGRHHIPAAPSSRCFKQISSSDSGKVTVPVPPAPRHVILGRGRALREASTQNVQGSAGHQSSLQYLHRKILVTGANYLAADSIYGHRLLVGSSPPTCQGKCGSCSPCNPIHVSVGSPHGALTQQEYYPEVWRCKCGNRLFMP